MNPGLLRYILHSLHVRPPGIQFLTRVLNCDRVSEFCIDSN